MKINNVFKFDYSKTNTYTILNGNCVKEIEKWFSPNYSSYNFEVESTYEYYTDKLNYTGMNGEYSFLGKNNTRLTKKVTYLRSGDTTTEEYGYEFDTEGKPAQANVKATTKHGTETYNVKLAYACN